MLKLCCGMFFFYTQQHKNNRVGIGSIIRKHELHGTKQNVRSKPVKLNILLFLGIFSTITCSSQNLYNFLLYKTNSLLYLVVRKSCTIFN